MSCKINTYLKWVSYWKIKKKMIKYKACLRSKHIFTSYDQKLKKGTFLIFSTKGSY